ncbi:predicted protein [Postia placenta Mad-698-R]|nr:predicted protein [Postia placenta Mad-698-R]
MSFSLRPAATQPTSYDVKDGRDSQRPDGVHVSVESDKAAGCPCEAKYRALAIRVLVLCFAIVASQAPSPASVSPADDVDAAHTAHELAAIISLIRLTPLRRNVNIEVEHRVVSQLLTLVNGLKARSNIVITAATNRPKSIDPALRRFGRFDREIDVGISDPTSRLGILRIQTKNMKLGDDVDLEQRSQRTPTVTSGQISHLCARRPPQIREKMDLMNLDEDIIDTEVLDSLDITMENFRFALSTPTPCCQARHPRKNRVGHPTSAGETSEGRGIMRRVDLGPLVGRERGFRTREQVPLSGGMTGVEMAPPPRALVVPRLQERQTSEGGRRRFAGRGRAVTQPERQSKTKAALRASSVPPAHHARDRKGKSGAVPTTLEDKDSAMEIDEKEERMPPKLRKGWIRKSFETLRDVYQRDAGDALNVSHNEAGAAGERGRRARRLRGWTWMRLYLTRESSRDIWCSPFVSYLPLMCWARARNYADTDPPAPQIFIKDVKCSNGTFIKGERLSPEGVESEPCELKSDDMEFGSIDIVGEDKKTIIHYKVAARVVCVFTEQEAQAAARAEAQAGPAAYGVGAGGGAPPAPGAFSFAPGQPPNAPGQQRRPSLQQGLIGLGDRDGNMRAPGKSGLTFDHVLSRLQSELQKSRNTGAELHSLTSVMNEIHDTLGGNLAARSRRTSLRILRIFHQLCLLNCGNSSKNLNNNSHVDKIRSLETMLAEHEAIKHEVGSLRELMEEMDMSRRRSGNPSGRHQYGHDDDMAHDQHYMSDDDDNVHSISTIVPHELDQVNKEDEEQLAVEEEEEQRRRRREELGCPRTPEPTGMATHSVAVSPACSRASSYSRWGSEQLLDAAVQEAGQRLRDSLMEMVNEWRKNIEG